MSDTLKALELITGILLKAGTATPIVFGAVTSIAAIVRALTGSGPGLRETADMIEAQLGANDTSIRAEVARLEALSANPNG